jgi:parvulin-like peptidyl-prolyl isomerase
MDTRSPNRPRALLAIGAAVGLALAAWDLVGGPAGRAPIPEDAVAIVDGVAVQRVDYERALQALASDRRTPLDDTDRRRLLDRLIDEELLVQKGLALGLQRRDGRVRSDIVASVVESVVSEATTREPTEDEIAAFFAENQALFARPGRVRVRQILFRVTSGVSDEQALARADDAVARLRAGEPFAKVASELGDAPLVELPTGRIDPATLREYLGPTVARAIDDLAVGIPSAPIRSAAGYHVVELVEREPAGSPELGDVKDQVRAELRRRNEDAALRAYVDDLRRSGDVRVREPAGS